MKMIKRMIAILIILSLFCSFTSVASADECYEKIKATYNTIGKGVSSPAFIESGKVVITFNIDDMSFSIKGKNASGKPESTTWNEVHVIVGVVYLSNICYKWDYYEDMLDANSSLEINLVSKKLGLNIHVFDAETAVSLGEYLLLLTKLIAEINDLSGK